MMWLLILLYPISAFAGWSHWYWFPLLPPVVIFLLLFAQAKGAADRMEAMGMGEDSSTRFLEEMGPMAYKVAFRNFLLYLVAFGLGLGAEALFGQ
jgi:hypothetical protein